MCVPTMGMRCQVGVLSWAGHVGPQASWGRQPLRRAGFATTRTRRARPWMRSAQARASPAPPGRSAARS